MANSCTMCRTNYFTVTDEDAFANIIDGLCGEGNIAWHKHDTDSSKVMFYCDYNLVGYVGDAEEGDYDNAHDVMIEKLQGVLPDGEAIIITEIGNEKMRCLHAGATIITNRKDEYMRLESLAATKAAEMLGDKDWATQMDY